MSEADMLRSLARAFRKATRTSFHVPGTVITQGDPFAYGCRSHDLQLAFDGLAEALEEEAEKIAAILSLANRP